MKHREVEGRSIHESQVRAGKIFAGAERLPLAVEVDGSLLKTDLLWKSFLSLIKQNPLTPSKPDTPVCSSLDGLILEIPIGCDEQVIQLVDVKMFLDKLPPGLSHRWPSLAIVD
jgi:hypothetical protein